MRAAFIEARSAFFSSLLWCSYATGGPGREPDAPDDPEDLASSSGSRVWGSGIPPRSCLPAAATVGFADVTSVPDAVFRLVSDVLILHRARDVDVRAKHEDIFGT